MRWFSSGAHGRQFLLVDIGSASVGAAGVVVLHDGRAVVSFSEREPITVAVALEPKHFFSATLHALRALIARVLKESRAESAVAARVHVFLHAPWIVSKTRSVRADFPEPTVLSESSLASVVHEAEKGIAENFRAAHREVAEAVCVVEKKITEYRVNGYEVASAVGQKAETLELTLLESFAPETASRHFTATLHALSGAPVEWHGAAAACAGALMGLAHEQGDALTVSFGGEATEVCIARRGVLHEIVSLPLGIHTLARAAVEAGAAHSVSAAEALLRAPSLASLADARRAGVAAARAAAAERFRRAVMGLLAPKIKVGFAPPRGVLLADAKDAPFYERAFCATAPRAKELSLPVCAVRGADAFAPAVQFFRSASPDTFLAGEAAFVALYEEGRKL